MKYEEGFYVKSGQLPPFTIGRSYFFTITGDNGERFEMMAFPQSFERIEPSSGIPAITNTRLIAHQILGRQKP